MWWRAALNAPRRPTLGKAPKPWGYPSGWRHLLLSVSPPGVAPSRPKTMHSTSPQALPSKHPLPSIPTSAQQAARDAFDLDEFFFRLDTVLSNRPKTRNTNRVHSDVATVGATDEELRTFAKDTLGAQRIRSDYLQALRVVLSNHAEAERTGLSVEHPQRVDFASAKTMRNIVDQMHSAGILTARRLGLGIGRVQVVYVYEPETVRPNDDDGEAPATLPTNLAPSDVPY